LLLNKEKRLGAALNIYSEMAPYFAVSGDFNHDGRSDLALVDGLNGYLAVMLSLTRDPLKNVQTINLPGSETRASHIVAEDFNGDGNLDLAVATNNGVSTLMGSATGKFTPSQTYQPVNATYLAGADFNRDGHLDLAVIAEKALP
jgi:hypothetical protein